MIYLSARHCCAFYVRFSYVESIGCLCWSRAIINENAHTAFIKWHCLKVIWNAICTKIHVHVQVLDFNGSLTAVELTHLGRVTHICVSKLTIIGSDNGLSPGWRQAIIWTNAGILLTRTLETNFSEILSKIRALSFKKMELKMSSAKWPQCVNGEDEQLHSTVYVGVIIYPCPNPVAGLAHLCLKNCHRLLSHIVINMNSNHLRERLGLGFRIGILLPCFMLYFYSVWCYEI